MNAQQETEEGRRDRQLWTGILRGFGGALLFSLPMLLTMEMWWLGFYDYRWRLVLMLMIAFPLIIGLAHFAGIRSNSGLPEDVIDGVTAYAIGLVTAAAGLFLIGIVTPEMPLREIVGKIMILAPLSGFGAIIARAQLGGGGKKKKERKQQSGYPAELFFVAAGAFYLGANVGATHEMTMIAYKMTAWHGVALLLVEVLIMHAFLYAMEFGGAPEVPRGTPWWSVLLRFTLPGVVVALAVSAYLLWTFGRFESFDPHWMVMFTLVLGLPCAIGGAAGRLLL